MPYLVLVRLKHQVNKPKKNYVHIHHFFNCDGITEIVGSICNELGIPHILANWVPEDEIDITEYHQYTRNFFPDNNFYAKALSQIIDDYEWKGFTLIYENNDCKFLTLLQFVSN